MTKVLKVFGGPGTGKTRHLKRIIEKEIEENSVSLKELVAVSFSNSAVNELCERIDVRRGSKRAPWFRTLHGLCLKALIHSGEIPVTLVEKMSKMGFVEGLISKFCRALGVPFEPEAPGASDLLGNRIFTTWTAVINRFYLHTRDLKECFEIFAQKYPSWTDIIKEWLKFKEEAGIFDYNDILIDFIETKPTIEAEVGIFDEVQDFSLLEWEVVAVISHGLNRAYYAGDDDQAVYVWKGATPEIFLSLEGEEHVLEQSYRLPSEILQFASQIIEKVQNRKAKNLKPARSGGIIKILPEMTLDELAKIGALLSAQNPSKTVFVLLRTNRMIAAVESVLLEMGVPYLRLKGRSPWDNDTIQAWNIVAKLRRGESLDTKELLFLLKHLNREAIPETLRSALESAIAGGSLPLNLFTALKQIGDPVELFDFPKWKKEILRKAEKPIDRAQINLYVDTIHASKGREADIVILGDGIPPAVESGLNEPEGLDAERRVFYVGATRARFGLLIAPISGFRKFITEEVATYVSL